MITHILVPTDFSDVAHKAVDAAKQLAEKCGASLHILHVKQIPVLDTQMPSDTYQLYLEEIDEAAKKGFSALEHTLFSDKRIAYTFHTATGFVFDEIQKAAKETQADMIVMGTTGASGLQQVFFGSNAASVINKSEIPVLVIPASVTNFEPKHIVYSTDYTDPEFPAVARLMYLSKLYDSKVTVVHVKTDYDRYFNASHNFFVRNKEQMQSNQIEIINIEGEEVTQALSRIASEQHADLVVVAKHNRSFFDRLFHRSLSRQLAFNTQVPLLVLHKD